LSTGAKRLAQVTDFQLEQQTYFELPFALRAITLTGARATGRRARDGLGIRPAEGAQACQ